jgi:hypothetical protein
VSLPYIVVRKENCFHFKVAAAGAQNLELQMSFFKVHPHIVP